MKASGIKKITMVSNESHGFNVSTLCSFRKNYKIWSVKTISSPESVKGRPTFKKVQETRVNHQYVIDFFPKLQIRMYVSTAVSWQIKVNRDGYKIIISISMNSAWVIPFGEVGATQGKRKRRGCYVWFLPNKSSSSGSQLQNWTNQALAFIKGWQLSGKM